MTITTKQALDIGEAVRSKALGYAAKTGTAIDLIVVQGADAKELFKLTPITLKAAITDNLSAEEIDELPMPGSRWNDGGIANNNCDIFQWKDPSKGGDAKPKEVSFYVTWADGTPEGARVVTEIDWCKRIGKDNMKLDDIPAKWQDKYSNPKMIDDRLSYLEGRRATIRAAYKEAVRLIWQLDMVNELAGCVATVDEDGGNQILLEDKDAPKKNWKHYSIGAFLRLNPKAAQEQGGSYAALKATEKREPKTPAPGTTITLNSVQTPETMDKVGVALHSYLDKALTVTGSADYALLLKHLTGDTGKQSILTLFGLHDAIGKLRRMDVLESIYATEKEKLGKAA